MNWVGFYIPPSLYSLSISLDLIPIRWNYWFHLNCKKQIIMRGFTISKLPLNHRNGRTNYSNTDRQSKQLYTSKIKRQTAYFIKHNFRFSHFLLDFSLFLSFCFPFFFVLWHFQDVRNFLQNFNHFPSSWKWSILYHKTGINFRRNYWNIYNNIYKLFRCNSSKYNVVLQTLQSKNNKRPQYFRRETNDLLNMETM